MAQSTESHSYSAGTKVDYTWSARFAIEPPQQLGDIVRRLGGLVSDFGSPEWPISGAVLGSGDETPRQTLVLGLDPSRNFGAPSIERCEEIVTRITETQGWKRESENPAEMRVIMGRRIGYEGDDYTLEEVRGLMVARGCGDVALTEADLFSLRYIDEVREYHEPGVIIEGAASNLDGVLLVAVDMGQERLVPEITDVVTQVYFQDRG